MDEGTTRTSRLATTRLAQRTGFAAALAVWKETPDISAASGVSYLLRIAGDPRVAHDSGYDAAVRELTSLASLPVTGDTDAQMAEAQADVTALDKFFGTPGLTPNS